MIAVQPTRGLDVGAIEYIHGQLIEQRDNGKGILLVSLELDEVMNVSDRILVIHDGEIVADLNPKETTVQELGLYMAGAKRRIALHEKLREFVRSDSFASSMSSIAAIIVGLLFGLIVLFITNAEQALDGFRTIIAGGSTGGLSGIGDVLYIATPLILTGLSVGLHSKPDYLISVHQDS